MIDPGFLFLVILHVLGFMAAVHALLYTRTAQGTLAWLVTLLVIPYVGLPLYALIGRRYVSGYIKARQQGDVRLNRVWKELLHTTRDDAVTLHTQSANQHVLEELARMPFTGRNEAQLLIDGKATFDRMFSEIEKAQRYILLQFYIVRHDRLGTGLKDLLIRKAREGVAVYFMYDDVGSHGLKKAYLREMREAGIQVESFNDTGKARNRFQLNFRNHRKTVIIDGRCGFVGGLNVGDEYMGESKRFSAWRDTHAWFAGPCILALQLMFLEDWYWLTDEIPNWNWSLPPARGNRDVLVLPTGPADTYETGALFFLHCINSARQRLWITSPYFVPDWQVLNALMLASLRGVDIRILLPAETDNIFIHLSGYASIVEACNMGMRFFQYPGFMHQKVLLIDDDVAAVGTANFGNRSFRLNFETTMLVVDSAFAGEVEAMLKTDFARSSELQPRELIRRPILHRLTYRIARLLSPLQ